jgi:hypothetical protein
MSYTRVEQRAKIVRLKKHNVVFDCLRAHPTEAWPIPVASQRRLQQPLC